MLARRSAVAFSTIPPSLPGVRGALGLAGFKVDTEAIAGPIEIVTPVVIIDPVVASAQ
jgi:hypothetical protein